VANGQVQDLHPFDLNNRGGAAGYRKVNGAWEPWDGATNNRVWDPVGLAWINMTQPGGTGGGYETVWLKNIAGSQVNPATEDGNLALIKAKTDNLDTALSGIKAGTDKIIAAPATSAKQDTIIANLQTLNSMVPSVYDYVSLGYTGADLTSVIFKLGGSGGTVVSTLTLAYASGNLTSVTKT
jgi:hypothetical protein